MRDAVARLLLASSAEWHVVLPPVLAAGPSATAPLVDALRAQPTAPGRQAAIAALGALGDQSACGFLRERIDRGQSDAAEAALALGRLGCSDAAPGLLATMRSGAAAIRNRTAAACALLDLGWWREAAPFLAAVLVADTAYAGTRTADFALPNKARWAEERTMAIAAIARACGGETFGLDPDAAHPQLARGVQAFERHLAEHGR